MRAFERSAAEAPSSIAVEFEDTTVTYERLNRLANGLARLLLDLGVTPGAPVGIRLAPGPHTAVAILGVLKAGGAYVPISADDPAERAAFVLRDTAARVLLTEERLVPALRACVEHPVALDTLLDTLDETNAPNPGIAHDPDRIAYVLYTSGSSGKPKGVMVPHGSLAYYLQWHCEHLRPALDHVDLPLSSSICFAAGVTQFYTPLLLGRTLHVLRQGTLRNPPRLFEWYAAHPGYGLYCVPTLWNELVTFAESEREAGRIVAGPQAVVLSGESATTGLVDRSVRLWPGLRLWNLYGPTEATANGTAGALEPGQPVSIGTAIDGTDVFLLDENLRAVPDGEAGEICICGEGVAAGYLNLPDLTRERFVRNPFDAADTRRMFRTGDLARRDERGRLVFIGRRDFQVKIRGYRIECGEIEAALLQHAAVRQAVVVCRGGEDDPGRSLVAYLTFQFARYASVDELRGFLAERLPDYMIPAAFVMLDAFPTLANGKVDRARLPEPGCERPALTYAFVPPGTVRERHLVRVWEQALGIDGVGIHDNFFDLGGDSLKATAALLRIRAALDVDVPHRVFFDNPTPAALAERLPAAGAHGQGAIERLPVRAAYPAAENQRSLWLLTETFPELTAYNMQFSIELRGSLDHAALVASVAATVRRHAVLRSVLRLHDDGRLMLSASDDQDVAVPLVDLRHLDPAAREAEAARLASGDSTRPFALDAGPLLRLRLFAFDDEHHRLTMTVHHAVFDGRSINVFCRDVAAHYRRASKGNEVVSPAALQYTDWIPWQRAAADRIDTQARAFWTRQLSGSPHGSTLPPDRPRPAIRRFRGARCSLRIDRDLRDRLEGLARRSNVTPYMALLAAFKVLLYRYSGQDDVIVGTPVANRNDAQLEELVGFFTNTLVLRTRLAPDQPFADTLASVRDTCLHALEYQDFSFERLLDTLRPERSLSQSPVFQVMFGWHERLFAGAMADGLAAEAREDGNAGAKYDLVLDVHEEEEAWDLRLTYDIDLYAGAAMERFLSRYVALLNAVAADASTAISRYPLATAEDLAQIETWNRTAVENEREVGLCRLFERQARLTPGAVAVVCGGDQLTFDALDRRASQLARHLRALGVRDGGMVGLHIEPSADMIVAILATLKAGAAYVPLDPYYPKDRLAQIVDDAGLGFVVAHEEHASRLDAASATVIALDADRAVIEALSDEPLGAPEVRTGGLMYVMYTSGSTGRPKGVMVPHTGACNYVLWMRERFPLSAADSVLFKTSINFDIAVWEIFLPLITGARLVVGRREELKAPESLTVLIRDAQITQIQFVPSALRAFVDSGLLPACRSLKRIFSGGEALPAKLQDDVFRQFTGELHNLYGPTEASIYVCHWACRPGEPVSSVPIGTPIHNSTIHLLDADGTPVGIGMTGEIHIGGAGVARGYFNRPDLTAAAFVPDPFSASPDARLFRTGDLARYRPGGEIEFLGRADRQVKVRGYRIELGEIEHHLSAHPEVKHAIIVVREDQPDDVRLVAYLLYRETHGPSESELRAYLRKKLPEYMLPSTFVSLDEIPLLPNNKANVAALPKPEYVKPLHADLERRYANAHERTLAGIWEEVLGTSRFGLDDSFFDAGGHSLLMARLGTLVEQRLHVKLSNIELFQFPTIKSLARHLSREGAADVSLTSDMARRAALARRRSRPDPVGRRVGHGTDN